MEATVKVEYAIVQVSARRYIVARLACTDRFSCPTGTGYPATWECRQGETFYGPATLAKCKQYVSEHTNPVAH